MNNRNESKKKKVVYFIKMQSAKGRFIAYFKCPMTNKLLIFDYRYTVIIIIRFRITVYYYYFIFFMEHAQIIPVFFF